VKGEGGVGAIPPSFLVSDILQLNQQQQQPGLRQVSPMFDLTRTMHATHSHVIASGAKQSHPQVDFFMLGLLGSARNDGIFGLYNVPLLVFYRGCEPINY
jgi:hypothetical protein